MLIDLEKNRDLELEDICGVVIKNCEKQNLDAPYTRAVSTILEFSYNKQRNI
jgi:2-dehydropantoate 2-reductase